MWISRIEPDKPDHDKRTFECPACDGVMTAIVKYLGRNERAPQYGALYAYAYVTLVRRQPIAVDWPQAL